MNCAYPVAELLVELVSAASYRRKIAVGLYCREIVTVLDSGRNMM